MDQDKYVNLNNYRHALLDSDSEPESKYSTSSTKGEQLDSKSEAPQ
jgi:hypothetical protein